MKNELELNKALGRKVIAERQARDDVGLPRIVVVEMERNGEIGGI